MPASYTLEVDWDGDGTFGNANADVTSEALDVAWERGRDYASALLGRSIAGKLSATLMNTDGKYSPSNTGSALTGKILPGRTVRLKAGSGSFPYAFPMAFNDGVQWQGKLDRILPAPAAIGAKTCKLTAFGVLGFLNQFETQLPTSTDQRTDQAIDAILTNVGWPDDADHRDLDQGQTTISRFWMSRKKAIDAMRLVEEAEAGFLKETKAGQVGFEDRYHRLTTAASTTSQATFSDAAGASHTYHEVSQDDPLTTIINHVEATARTFDTAGAAALWTHPETGAASPTLAASEAKTFEAEYPNPSAANNAMEVDAWTTPAATTDYLANTASDGSGTNKTADISVSQTKSGERMVMTFTNGSSEPVYMTKIQARGTAVTTNNPCIVRAIDTTSQTAYGDRKYVAKTKFLPTTSEAQDWCDYHMAVYGSPIEILTMAVPASAPNNIGQMLSRDISDRITVVADNDTALGIDGDFFVEAVQHQVTDGGMTHVATWKLSPALGGYARFWKLGVGVLGTSTVPAY